MVKSLLRDMVLSERPKSWNRGGTSSSSSSRKAHLGVKEMGGGSGVTRAA